ncbi:hypothetical protein BUALT_Bualt13G0030200 [Buddleja alternifolia]|uniref:C3H1-type domain-containing protein n=1 Tax=Buddleja alternifolia TaxID=168488 RepID=A0AAV6WR18_9LAMI|nr:hypothetical protein BUALT_Bualt13G0030200 [Buddleja alternifolia]
MEFGGARKRGRAEGGVNGNGGFKKSKQEMESFTNGIGSKLKPCTKFFRWADHVVCYQNLLYHLRNLPLPLHTTWKPPTQNERFASYLDYNKLLQLFLFNFEYVSCHGTFFCSSIDLTSTCSASGCPFGEGCHFLHYVPGGIKAVTQILGNNPALPSAPRNPIAFPEGPSPVAKSRLCSKYKTAEGCKFGDKCRFAHGEWELNKPSHDDPRVMGQVSGRYGGGGVRFEPTPPNLGMVGGFGASATAKISIDASMAGPVIGKAGVNSKQICRVTGAKLSVRDHESDPNLRNIELEGTFDQIKQASQMVRELIVSVGAASGPPMRNPGMSAGPASNYKTKLCEKFSKGSCTFGERCHFAHGEEELRKSGL